MKVVSAVEMRRLDQLAQQDFQKSGFSLMQEAGAAMAQAIEDRFHPRRLCIVCGKGNNAGDGFVIAYQFHLLRRQVVVVCLETEADYHGDAFKAWTQLNQTDISVVPAAQLFDSLGEADVVIDALLGTGLTGSAREPYAEAIDLMNSCPLPTVSVDVPSGLRDLKPGEEIGRCVEADLTLTVGLPKSMLLTLPGSAFAGVVITLPINFPQALLESDQWQLNWAPWDEMRQWLPERPGDSNKGTYGHVGIIGSALNYAGASILVARAALRSGCGLATIYSLPTVNPIYKVALPEATSIVLMGQSEWFFDSTSAAAFAEHHNHHSVLAVGPGLGTARETTEFLLQILLTWKGPVVLDADALNILANDHLDKLPTGDNVLITPHPGEMARLTQMTTAEVQADRETVARDFARRHKLNVLLKGTGTFVARPDGQVWLVPGSEPALAKGGTGDVLTGLIASLFAQGMPMWQAAVLGASVHLEAGSRAAEIHGSRGVLASEVADQVPHVLDR